MFIQGNGFCQVVSLDFQSINLILRKKKHRLIESTFSEHGVFPKQATAQQDLAPFFPLYI